MEPVADYSPVSTKTTKPAEGAVACYFSQALSALFFIATAF